VAEREASHIGISAEANTTKAKREWRTNIRPGSDLALVESSERLVDPCKDPAKQFGDPLEFGAGFLEEAVGDRPLA
jgi:hypothetical protein